MSLTRPKHRLSRRDILALGSQCPKSCPPGRFSPGACAVPYDCAGSSDRPYRADVSHRRGNDGDNALIVKQPCGGVKYEQVAVVLHLPQGVYNSIMAHGKIQVACGWSARLAEGRVPQRRDLLLDQGTARAGRALARPLQHRQTTLLAGLQTTRSGSLADLHHGAWISGNRYALPTYPHPRRRLLELLAITTLTNPKMNPEKAYPSINRS